MLARVLVVLALFVPLPAQAGLLDLLRPKLTNFPSCHAPKVLHEIVERFNEAEEDLWHRGLVMTSIGHARERAELTEPRPGEHDPRLIPRRYCTATAVLNRTETHRAHKRTVLYLIEGGQGFAGTHHEVFFCINGLDPWRVYDGNCEVLRRYN